MRYPLQQYSTRTSANLSTPASVPPIPPGPPPSSAGGQDHSASPPAARGRNRNRRGRGARATAQPAQDGQQQPAVDGAGTARGGRPTARGRGSRGGGAPRGGRTGRAGRGGAAGGGGSSGTVTPVESSSAQPQAQEQANGDSHPPPPPASSNRGSRQHSRQSSRSTSRAPVDPSSTVPSADASHQQPQQPRAGRRAKFNASLSSSTSLTPSAPSFSPTVAPPPVIAAPVNQTLLSRLTHELTTSSLDCSICFSPLRPREPISSCATCYTPFHLPCIREWAERSVAETRERAELLATREGRKEEVRGEWRCPSCQTRRGEPDVPRRYSCFCGRQHSPQLRPGTTPHSCGQPCARPRPPGCSHSSCGLNCHPGPCPGCSIVLQQPCHCGKETKQVRCSALHPPPSSVVQIARETLLSCHQTCGRPLACGEHTCQQECHEGECEPCGERRGKRCYCGREEVEEECGRSEGRKRVEGCRRVQAGGEEGEEEEKKREEGWLGEFSCSAICSASFDCLVHKCQQPCHPHLSSTPLPCPLSPSFVTTCPCGQTDLSSLLDSPRQSCTDPIPTCTKQCSKVLPCGHFHHSTCHQGDCGPCTEQVTIPCRCGSTSVTRLCSSSPSSSPSDAEEVTCTRVCRALLSCGRHACGRQCCPLSWQEALKTKGKKRVAVDEWQGAEDPLGLHQCTRVCGRRLNCGVHNCAMTDHRGACPPCLRADFDELVCHCGSTVVLPPIPCSFRIDCRAPCIRPSTCGHAKVPHACHEEPTCPPCPFLMEKTCACGKKQVANVRCSTDEKKVSCGTVCGKLLRCGYHRCRKSCHPAGDCEACDQVCLKPRKPCGHPCPATCHSPTACPSDIPCEKLITVSCACGHLQQSARCSACDAKPEGNQGRLLKCSDACAAAKRSAMLAEALGVEKREPRRREVEYDPLMMSFYGANVVWCNSIEAQLAEFVKGDKPSLHFPVMKRPQRAFTHELAELFDLRSESLDEEPRRSVVIHRQSNSGIPVPTLADALAAQRKSASTVLTFGSLRKPAAPERKPTNAIFLEGVLGFDEGMLKDILRPLTRGLIFSCSWVGEEDVLVTFDHPPTIELEQKISSMVNSFRTLAEDTGFCATVEPVYHSPEDGKITRGAWTPVATSSRSGSGFRSNSHTPVFTPNAFASLGGGIPSAPAPTRMAWGSGGGVVGPAAYKPPRAVVAPVASRERPPPPHHLPSNGAIPSTTPRLPTPPLQDEKDIPDDWDAEDEDSATIEQDQAEEKEEVEAEKVEM